ncbi:hypothetical protein DICA3_D07426 [Diutina catenulata]
MVDYKQWMNDINDDTKITRISIPGTHNSAACHTALPSVQCQGESLTDQLNNGVRFLDFRVGRMLMKEGEESKDLMVVHGKFPVKIPFPLKFSDALKEVLDWLKIAKSETVIVSIKQEGSGEWDNDHDEFGKCIWDRYINPSKNDWYLNPSIPTLGDCRGKAVLFRRFGVQNDELRREFGFDAAWWTYNTTDDDRGEFVVQDFNEVKSKDDLGKKIDYVKSMLNKARSYNEKNDNKLFVNFTSGSNFFDPSVWPQPVSEAMIQGNLDSEFKKGSGILVLDYAEADNWKMPHSLVNSNF